MKFLPFLTVALIVFLLFPFGVKAVKMGDPCTSLPYYSAKLCDMFNRIAIAVYIMSGGVALIVVLSGGITIMTAGGSGDRLNKGKKILIFGLLGAALIVCAGFLLDLLAEFLGPLIIAPR